MASHWYVYGLADVMNGDIDLDTDTFKVMLLSNAHTTDKSDRYRDDIDGDEVSGTGYTAGGVSLASPAISANTGDARVEFDATDTVFSSVTLSNVRYAAIYKVVGSAATDKLILINDFGSDKSASGTDMTVQWSSSGAGRVAV